VPHENNCRHPPSLTTRWTAVFTHALDIAGHVTISGV
jgi:hypothetical protein